MRFDVEFFGSVGTWQPIGQGQVILEETGLVLLGRSLRVPMPMAYAIFVKVAGAESMRTVPYSYILKHVPPDLISRGHRVEVRPLVPKQKSWFRFRMAKPRRKHDQQFAERLVELRKLAAHYYSA